MILYTAMKSTNCIIGIVETPYRTIKRNLESNTFANEQALIYM